GARKRVKDSGKERDVQFGFISDPAGFMTLYARMYAADGNAFEQRVLDMARRLCPDDPRSGEDRLNDALAAVGAGRVLRCECGNADCPGATGDKPAKDVVVHLIASEDTLNEARRKAQQARTPQPETDGESVDEPEIVAEAAEPAAEGQDATAPHTTEGDADESVRDAGEPARPQKPECPAPAFVFGAGIANSALLAAFLDRATIRTVTHPGDAPPEPQYRPSAALSEFIRCRDLTCRFPHCDVPATRCDIDHTIPWPAGPTCGSNLKCLCRKHHLLKTFWTGKTGWRDEQFADGTVVWTSPSGDTYTTHPGSAQFFPTLAEPTAEAPVRENPQATENRGLKMPKRRRTRAQNRARYIDEQRKLNDDFVAERNRPPPF
ncbi:HNH endonuclease signature motif containing protein, partial [Mycobacterium sp. GA-2829]|uniref:HNH endonuclease signature motif containing protein n=1 Tax=Mycobacterium sp. GA-2829 TaxID=1772283 RepID=UPI000B17EF67